MTEHVISRGTPFWRETWSFLGGKIGEIGRLTTPFLGTKDEGKWYQRKEYCVKNLGLTPLTFQVKTKYKHWKAFLRLFWNLPNYWLIFKSFFSCFSMTSDNSSAPLNVLSALPSRRPGTVCSSPTHCNNQLYLNWPTWCRHSSAVACLMPELVPLSPCPRDSLLTMRWEAIRQSGYLHIICSEAWGKLMLCDKLWPMENGHQWINSSLFLPQRNYPGKKKIMCNLGDPVKSSV